MNWQDPFRIIDAKVVPPPLDYQAGYSKRRGVLELYPLELVRGDHDEPASAASACASSPGGRRRGRRQDLVDPVKEPAPDRLQPVLGGPVAGIVRVHLGLEGLGALSHQPLPNLGPVTPPPRRSEDAQYFSGYSSNPNPSKILHF